MTLLPVGAQAPTIETTDDAGDRVYIPALERYTLVWFGPIFTKFGCRECQTSLLHELYPDLRMSGCFPYGATFDPPHVNARRNEPHVWRVPIVQVTRAEAEEWGALRDPTDSWFAYTPRPVSYLVGPDGVILQVYDRPDPKTHAADVLEYLKKEVPHARPSGPAR